MKRFRHVPLVGRLEIWLVIQVGIFMGDTVFFLGWWVPPNHPPFQIKPVDLENANPFLESHESHAEEGKSYVFGNAPTRVSN